MTDVLDTTAEGSGMLSVPRLRTAGLVALMGAVVMLVGAALYFAGGADAWLAVSSGDTEAYFTDAAANTTVLYAGLFFWVLGATTMAVGGGLLAGVGGGPAGMAARSTYAIGAAAAVVAFLVLAALVRLAGSGSTSYELGDVLAFLGTTLDDVATIFIIGVSPVLVGLSGKATWMPGWLSVWAWLCGIAGAVATLAIFMGASSTLGFALVPIGIGWLIAVGVFSMRRA